MITVSADQLKRAQAMLKGVKNGAQKACAAAINRAADMSRTEITRIITREYFVKARDVNATMHIRGASMSTLAAEITSKGRAIPLGQFKITGNPLKRLPVFPKSSQPVTVQVRRDQSGTASKRTFAAKSRQGAKFALYMRTGAKRYPIRGLFGPPVPVMMGVERNMKAINKRAQEILDRRFEHEIERLQQGWGK